MFLSKKRFAEYRDAVREQVFEKASRQELQWTNNDVALLRRELDVLKEYLGVAIRETPARFELVKKGGPEPG